MSPVLPVDFLTISPTPVALLFTIFADAKELPLLISNLESGAEVPIPTLPPLKNESPTDLIFTIS